MAIPNWRDATLFMVTIVWLFCTSTACAQQHDINRDSVILGGDRLLEDVSDADGVYECQKLYRVDLSNKAFYRVWVSAESCILSCSVSAGMQPTACATVTTADGDRKTLHYRSILIDKGYAIIGELPDACIVSWRPEGNQIAYAEGHYWEKPLFDPVNTWLYDVKTGKKESLGIPSTDLEWAAFDGKLYVESKGKILRYDEDRQAFDDTTYKALHFSTGGKYAYAGGIDDPPSIYEQESGTLVSRELWDRTDHKLLGVSRWLDDEMLALEYVCKTYIYNCRLRTVEEFEGRLLGVRAGDQHLVLMKKDRTMYEVPSPAGGECGSTPPADSGEE